MPLHPIQRGELTDRLRRFFGLVGSYSAQLEAIVNPVALVQDLSQQPYRENAIGWQVGGSQTAGVGQQSELLVFNASTQVVIVDRLVLQTDAAAGEPCFLENGQPNVGAVATDAINTDALEGFAGVIAPVMPVQLWTGLVPGGPVLTTVYSVLNVPAPVNGSLVLDHFGYVLPPNYGVGIRSSNVNVTIRLHAQGRLITDASINAPRVTI